MKIQITRTYLPAFLFVSATFLGACGDSSAPPPTTPATTTTTPVTTPLIKKAELADWCPEHGVPESVCTRCNAPLIQQFKDKGDWCSGHSMPESQCIACNPELEAKFKAMAPKTGG